MKVNKNIRDILLLIQREKKVSLEGNILKLMEAEEGDVEFEKYLEESIEKDKNQRRRRLEVTKQVQKQNIELINWQKENTELTNNLKKALAMAEDSKNEAIKAKEEAEDAKYEAEEARNLAINDLDILQKKTQTELIGTIVKVSLIVILSVGVITTTMYGIALWKGNESQIISSTWSNTIGILLTNAFSIVGTIMGVKYASEKK